MKVRVEGIIRELQIVDKNGIDFTADFIGNQGALIDGQFSMIDVDKDLWEADQATFDWWETMIEKTEEAEEQKNALIEKLDDDKRTEFIELLNDRLNIDFEDIPAAIIDAVEEIKQEYPELA